MLPRGIEPLTSALGKPRSIQLSYGSTERTIESSMNLLYPDELRRQGMGIMRGSER